MASIKRIVDVCHLRTECKRPCYDCIYNGEQCQKVLAKLNKKHDTKALKPCEYFNKGDLII